MIQEVVVRRDWPRNSSMALKGWSTVGAGGRDARSGEIRGRRERVDAEPWAAPVRTDPGSGDTERSPALQVVISGELPTVGPGSPAGLPEGWRGCA